MLQSMRKSAKSWAMFVLFGLLILSFAVWGIGDVFQGGVSDTRTVVSVGKSDVTVAEYRRSLDNAIQQFQARTRQGIDYRQARALGLADRVMQQIINERLLALGAQEAGITITNELVSKVIREDRIFKDQFDRFDRQLFLSVLARSQLSEQGYVDLRKAELANAQLTGAVTANGYIPKSFVARYFRFQNQRRVADVVFLPDTIVKTVPDPTEKQLEDFRKKNAANYRVPELRKVIAIVLDPAVVGKTIKIADRDIRALYESRKAEFTTPEKRTVSQILLRDEATAKKAHAALKGGDSFEKVAKEIANQSGGPLPLGSVTRAQVPIEALRDAAFKPDKEGVTEPVKSPLGWHILNITKIEKAGVKTLDEVKAELVEALQRERAVAMIPKLGEKLEDETGEGTKLEDAAKKLGLKVLAPVPFDRRGNDENGKKVAGLPSDASFLREVFDLSKGEDSGIVEAGNEMQFILRVDTIIKPTLPPVDKIKDKLTADWKAAQRASGAERKAKEMLEKLKDARTLAKVAEGERLTVRTTSPFLRTGQDAGANVSAGLVQKLFKAKVGETVMQKVDKGVTLATLKEIKAAEPAKNDAGVTRLRTALLQSINADLLDGFSRALRARHEVDIDRDVLNRIFTDQQR